MRLLNSFFTLMVLLIGISVPYHASAANLIPDQNAGKFTSIQAQPCPGKVDSKTQASGPSAASGEDVQCTVNKVTSRIIAIVFYLMGAIAVLLLIFAGIQYIQSNGSPEGTKKARATITNVILGIIVLTAAYAIINLLIGAVGYFNPAV